MPTCQQIMSVTVSGPFTIGPTSSPSCDVLPPARLGAARRLARVLRLDRGDLRRRCTARSRWRRTSCARAPSSRSVRIMSRYWPDSSGPSSSRNTWRRPLVDGPLGELARLVEHADERVAAARPGGRVAAAPTTRGRSRRRTRARRAADRPSCSVAVLGGDLGDLVLADQRVAADERRRRDRAAPAGRRAVGRGRTTAGCRRRRHSATWRNASIVGTR